MSKYCVVVADGARARLFSLDEAGVGIGEGGPDLVELSDLANSEVEAAGQEIYSNVKSGRNVGSAGGGAHGYDDHRDQHIEESERRFAKQIAAAATDAVVRQKPGCLVVSADPHMMGHLREAMNSSVGGIQVKEVVKDLTKLAPQELHEYLAGDHMLPARQTPV